MMKKTTTIATVMALTFGVSSAYATSALVSTGGSFQMDANEGLDQAYVDGSGVPTGTDTTISGWVDETAGTWGVSSTNTFWGFTWTATNGQLVTDAGDYALDTVTGAISLATPDTVGTADGIMHFTIGANQIAGIIDFAWSATTGIRVVNVWDINADGSLSYAAVPGMENGPFPAYNPGFELTGAGLVSPVPLPAAVWLFGSGLIGLIGIAKRKKNT